MAGRLNPRRRAGGFLWPVLYTDFQPCPEDGPDPPRAARSPRLIADLAAAPGKPPTALTFWLLALALGGLTLAAFLPVLRGSYIWDDQPWLTHNANIIEPHHFWNIWSAPRASPHYYPLVFTTFWLEYQMWGLGILGADGIMRGVGYHVDNLLLHIISAILLFQILLRLKLPGGTFGGWLAATIFAIHPVNVESVAWVAERKNTLCAVFFFASLLLALRARLASSTGIPGRRASPERTTCWRCCFSASSCWPNPPPVSCLRPWSFSSGGSADASPAASGCSSFPFSPQPPPRAGSPSTTNCTRSAPADPNGNFPPFSV